MGLLNTLDQPFESGNILVTSSDALLNWARLSSLWQMSFGLACCAIEMMAASASHYDMNRFGVIPNLADQPVFAEGEARIGGEAVGVRGAGLYRDRGTPRVWRVRRSPRHEFG